MFYAGGLWRGAARKGFGAGVRPMLSSAWHGKLASLHSPDCTVHSLPNNGLTLQWAIPLN